MLGGETRLVALLGDPVAHSRSPRMQNAAFAARGLDWAYVACRVGADEFDTAVRGLAALGFAGANVTIPHKAAAAHLSDELDEAAERGGSVNTLVFRDGRIEGSSTDGQAVIDAAGGVAGARVLVLGGGGAARAVAAALEHAGAAEVRVATRSEPDWPPDGADATLLVNATPLIDEMPVAPRAGQAVVDLAYRADASPTALVEAARAAGCDPVVDGIEVLVRQGAAAFQRWTGVLAPLDVMRAAARAP
ncbi:MAG: shikimate dehydrogenase family protein [Gaiellaceae bacterium]